MYPMIDIVAPSRHQNHSALPQAPVVADPPPRRTRAATVLARLLRSAAGTGLRVADQLDPAPRRPLSPACEP